MHSVEAIVNYLSSQGQKGMADQVHALRHDYSVLQREFDTYVADLKKHINSR